MKKYLIFLLFILMVTSYISAEVLMPFNPSITFRPVSARTEGMGGAGVATATGADAFFMNPANLGSRKFSINLPSVSITAYNVKNLIDEGVVEELVNGESSPSTATKLLNSITAENGEILTTDIAMSFTGGGFGLGIQLQEQLHNQGSGEDTTLIAELNAAASVGFGFRLNFIPDVLSVDVGATVRPTYKAYTQNIDASVVEPMISGTESPENTIFKETALAAGYAIPFDVGVNVNLPVGLRVSAVAKNLNGAFTMQNYSESGAWVNEMMEMAGQESIYNDENPADTEIEPFSYEVPWTLDFGLGWVPDLGGFGKVIRPTLALDFVDVLGMFEELKTYEDAYWNYLRVGAEVKMLSMIDVRAGLNRGYWSVGVGLDLLVIHLDASYYWREFGPNIGDAPVDALTVRFNLGVDGR